MLRAALTLVLSLPIVVHADDVPKIDKDLEGNWEPSSAVLDGSERPKPPPEVG